MCRHFSWVEPSNRRASLVRDSMGNLCVGNDLPKVLPWFSKSGPSKSIISWSLLRALWFSLAHLLSRSTSGCQQAHARQDGKCWSSSELKICCCGLGLSAKFSNFESQLAVVWAADHMWLFLRVSNTELSFASFCAWSVCFHEDCAIPKNKWVVVEGKYAQSFHWATWSCLF